MSTHAYQEVLNEVLSHVQYLSLDEQLKLVQDLENLIRTQAQVKPMHNLTELEGLGVEIWKGVDVKEYINRERDSWDG